LPELASDFRLVLAGKVGWMTETLFSQITGLGLENRVILPGYVADTDKAALLSGAEAFLFPSLYEGFGLPVLEAQSCGCPVMTSTTSSLSEVAGDSALLVDPADGRAITGAMRRLATDSDLRRALSAAGQRNVCRFSWASSAQELLRIIGDLME
ncbi:MAG: glycosyltransferase family 4 protein, partial [Anaerolineae bacterium]|nr:glycosyltransferase family 4 protein [Anaerolineae bacterium]